MKISLRNCVLLTLGLLLAACQSSGEHAASFVNRGVADAYLPLKGPRYLVLDGLGAAVVIAPGIAVTNAHNANILDAQEIIGISTEYDLLFFHTTRGYPLAQAPLYQGQKVIAYGQGEGSDLRKAEGVVRWTIALVLPRCATCATQEAFAFEADAGKGFSGGPVIDAGTGLLVGITFGFRDNAEGANGRLMYAYSMARVMRELAALQGRRLP